MMTKIIIIIIFTELWILRDLPEGQRQFHRPSSSSSSSPNAHTNKAHAAFALKLASVNRSPLFYSVNMHLSFQCPVKA